MYRSGNTAAGSLTRLAPDEGALGFSRAVPLHRLLSVVDVVLALTTLLGGQRFPEFALGLVLSSLILLSRLILLGLLFGGFRRGRWY